MPAPAGQMKRCKQGELRSAGQAKDSPYWAWDGF